MPAQHLLTIDVVWRLQLFLSLLSLVLSWRCFVPTVALPIALRRQPQAISFVEKRKYHAINNNCIHTTDFLGRVLTLGALRNGPLIYDALVGSVPQQDHPMLLMFFLMTQLSWYDSSEFTSDTLTSFRE